MKINRAVRQRARHLLETLPKEGEAHIRAGEAQKAIDTLVKEYPVEPELDAARLARAVGKASKKKPTSFLVYQMGLEAIADGMAGSGAALAGLGLRMISEGTSEKESLSMSKAALKELGNREEVRETMLLSDSMRAGWFNPGFSNSQKLGFSETILKDAEDGVRPEDTALKLLGSAVTTGTGGHVRRSAKIARSLIDQFRDTEDPARNRTYDIAASSQGFGLNAVSMAGGFLADFPHTTAGRAERLMEAGPIGARSSWVDKSKFQSAVSKLAKDARQEGDPNWKVLSLAAAAGGAYSDGKPVEMMSIGLKASTLGIPGTERGLAATASSILEFKGPHDRCHNIFCKHLNPRLQKLTDDRSWKSAFKLISDSLKSTSEWSTRQPEQWSANTLKELSGLAEGRSPLLKVCQEFLTDAAQMSTRDLKAAFTSALSMTSEEREISALRAAMGTLEQTGGREEARKHLDS